jgi:hypothetical protein
VSRARDHNAAASGRDRVAEEARALAEAWSAPGSPPSWRLTAALFTALAADRDLLELAASVPPDRHPALLFAAASCRLVARHRPALAAAFPHPGEPQPPPGDDFAVAYRDFVLAHRDELSALLRAHRYQMNEVGRCAQIAPGLARAAAADRPDRGAVLIDVGTGAGLGLWPDRYRYRYLRPDGGKVAYGPPESPLTLDCRLLGALAPPMDAPLPRIADRAGIEVDPVDLDDAEVTGWLAACVPPEAEAVTRFAGALALARAEAARVVAGDACSALPGVLAGAPPGPLVVVVDSFVAVFFPDEERRRLAAILDSAGRERDLAWISLDPLVPLGPEARESVQGIAVPHDLVRRSREEGLFGVLGLVEWRDGRRREALLARAHPSGEWMEWLERP